MDRPIQIYRFNGSDEDRQSLVAWIVGTSNESGLAGMGDAGARWVAAQMEDGDLLVTLDGAHFARYKEVSFDPDLEDEPPFEVIDTEGDGRALRDDTALRLEAVKMATEFKASPSDTIRWAGEILKFLKGESE